MAASLLFPGIDGVHRWLPIGPTHLNVSMAFVPIILYAIGTTLSHKAFLPIALVIGVSIIHVLQPDAGQATTFGSAAIVIFLLTNGVPFYVRCIGIVVIATGMMWTWRQTDALPAVEYVEHILHLAASMGIYGIALITIAITSLLAPILYTLLLRQKISSENDILATAFAVYLVAAFGVTEMGNYPVPIIGAGASSVLGWYFIIGLTAVRYPAPKLPNTSASTKYGSPVGPVEAPWQYGHWSGHGMSAARNDT